MTICLLDSIVESAERVRVGILHYKPERLPKERRDAGITLEGLTAADIPQPDARRGAAPVLYADPIIGRLWWEYVERPLTHEEVMADILAAMEKLTAKVDTLTAKMDALGQARS